MYKQNSKIKTLQILGVASFICALKFSYCYALKTEKTRETEITTLDPLIIWSGSKEKFNNDSTTAGGNIEILKTKRKSEIMCEKIYRDNNIVPTKGFNFLEGEDVKVGQIPHMASLGFLGRNGTIKYQACSGALIAPRFLLTSAHCVKCPGCSTVLKARLAVVNKGNSASAQDVDVEETIVADYDSTSSSNDIALVKLKKDVQMSQHVYPACLYTGMDDPVELQLTGWGWREIITSETETPTSDILQLVFMKPVSREQCNITMTSWNKYKVILPIHICAKSKSNICKDDLTGILQVQKEKGGFDIVGVTATGVISCSNTYPDIYTRVSAYLDWIEERVWPD